MCASNSTSTAPGKQETDRITEIVVTEIIQATRDPR